MVVSLTKTSFLPSGIGYQKHPSYLLLCLLITHDVYVTKLNLWINGKMAYVVSPKTWSKKWPASSFSGSYHHQQDSNPLVGRVGLVLYFSVLINAVIWQFHTCILCILFILLPLWTSHAYQPLSPFWYLSRSILCSSNGELVPQAKICEHLSFAFGCVNLNFATNQSF